MKNETNRSGVKLHLLIPCINVRHFLAGERVRAWPTNPAADCPGTGSRKDRETYFPTGGTLVEVDPDQITVGEHLSGIFFIQRNGVKGAKVRRARKTSLD